MPEKFVVLGPGLGDAILEFSQNPYLQDIAKEPIHALCMTENDGVLDLVKGLPFSSVRHITTYDLFRVYPGGPSAFIDDAENVSTMPRNNPRAHEMKKESYCPKFATPYPVELEVFRLPYVFINLYSTTPAKVVAEPVVVERICMDLLEEGFLPILQGHDTDLGEEASFHGYPPTCERYPYLKGCTYWEGSPRTNCLLVENALGCVLSESAYLQAATAYKTPFFCLLGKNLQPEYERKMKMDDPFYRGFEWEGNQYAQVNSEWEGKWQSFLELLRGRRNDRNMDKA